MLPELTVIIPTYNGAHKLPVLLRALEAQTTHQFKVVIVVDGSTDQTLKVLRKWEGTLAITVIEQTNLGRAASRNAGAAYATSEYLLFLDDDMEPAPNVVTEHLNLLHTEPKIIHIGRQVGKPNLKDPDFVRFRKNLTQLWEQDIPANIPLRIQEAYLTAAHFSISKAIFQKLEGFDTRLTDAEDYDFALRAIISGYIICYRPHLLAWHHDTYTCSDTCYRQKQYQLAHKKLLEIHPEYQKYHKYTLHTRANLIKSILYWCLRASFWHWVIDNFNVIMIFNKKIRTRIYAAVVHASSMVTT